MLAESQNYADTASHLLQSWSVRADPPEKRPFPMCYHAKFGHSRLKGMGVKSGPKKFGNTGAPPHPLEMGVDDP